MIIFKKLRFQNFLATGNNFIEFILNQHDTTLIVGANGTGKSTLLDALSFVLFGKAYRKINKPQLVNSITRKNCLVEIEFSIGESDFMVVRGINPTVFEVYQDGRLLNQQANSRDYQEILEEQILKAAHKSFCQIVILGTAAFEPFMQLTTPQRREVIEDLLDLQVFTNMNLDLKERASENNKALAMMLVQKEALAKQLELLKHHAGVIEANREEVHAEKTKKLKELQDEYDDLVIEIRGAELNISKLQEAIEDEHKIVKKLAQLKEYQHGAMTKRNEAQKSADFLEEHSVCPTCTQEIVERFKRAKVEDLRTLEKQYVNNVSLITKEVTATEERLSAINEVKENIHDWKLNLQVMKSRKASINKQTDEIKKDVQNLSKTSDIAKDIPKVEKALEEASHSCIELEERKKIYSYASLILKDTGIKSKIIKQYVPIMNRLINKNLSEFDMHVTFELDENFNENIRSRHRDDFTYESFSQGERQRIDLAILFAWRGIAALRNTINTNILILDEVFDSSLDNAAVEYLMNTIRIHAQTNNIFVISHKDQMFDKFENIIRMIKTRNFTIVEEA